MATELKDVLRVNEVDATIVGGSIKTRMIAIATDTKKIIARTATGYLKYPAEGISTYFDDLAAGYPAGHTNTEALDVNGDIYLEGGSPFNRIHSSGELLIGDSAASNIDIVTGASEYIRIVQGDTGAGSSRIDMVGSLEMLRKDNLGVTRGDLFLGDTSISLIKSDGSAVNQATIGLFDDGKIQLTPLDKVEVDLTSGTIDLSNSGILGTFGGTSFQHNSSVMRSNDGTNEIVLTSSSGINHNPASTPSYQERLLYWDEANHCYSFYNDRPDVSMQIGRELWKRLKNNTGSTKLNGKVAYISGESAGELTFDLANASGFMSSQGTIGFLTEDINNADSGEITMSGTVRGVDTTGETTGMPVFLDIVSGEWTCTPPPSPNYLVRLGSIGLVGASGTIEANVSIGNNTQTIIEIFNGTILEDRDVSIVSNGTIVECTLEKQGGGDLTLFFNGSFIPFDSTPAARVTLTHGTDASPILNYIYIPESTGILTANTTGFPTAQHVPIGKCYCQSAASVQSDRPMLFHEWTEHLVDSNNQGHMSHIDAWIRAQHATYVENSGLVVSFSGSGTGTVGMGNTTGKALQLHEHNFPAFVDPAEIYLHNHPTIPNTVVSNIHDIDVDSAGNSLDGSTFAVTLVAVISEDEAGCKWIGTLPSGSYGQNKPDETRVDILKYSNFSFPTEYKGAAILVHRLIVSRNPSGTTSTIYLDPSDDLRGKTPDTTAGGTGGADSPWITEGANIYYDTGNIRVGTDASSGDRTIISADLVQVYNGAEQLRLQATGLQISGNDLAGESFVFSPTQLYITTGSQAWFQADQTFGQKLVGDLLVADNFAAPAQSKLHLIEHSAVEVCAQFSNSITGYGVGSGLCVGVDASGNSVINNYIESNMIFKTFNTEAMRITSVGDIGIGLTTPSYTLDVGPTVAGDYVARILNQSITGNGLQVRVLGANDTNILDCLDGAAGVVLRVKNNGEVLMPQVYSDIVGGTNIDLHMDNTGKLGYVSSSLRYKTDINKEYDSSFIQNIETFTYRLKNGSGGMLYGAGAEEMEHVNKNFIFYNKNGVPESIKYKELITPMIKEIQAAKKERDKIKAELASLKEAVAGLLSNN